MLSLGLNWSAPLHPNYRLLASYTMHTCEEFSRPPDSIICLVLILPPHLSELQRIAVLVTNKEHLGNILYLSHADAQAWYECPELGLKS